jgi:hypothetical protein
LFCGLLAVPAIGAEPAKETQEKPKADPYGWKSLFDGKTLKDWKAPQFGGQGEVKVEDGTIVLGLGEGITGVTYTGDVPKTNYEFTFEGKRVDGNDFFSSPTFPVGDSHCTFVAGGWAGTVVGLSSVDFYDASDNLTTKFMQFKANQWYRYRVRVSDSKIECWIDDEKMVTQERKGHKFSIRWEVDECRPLGISSWCTKGAVRNVRLRELKPEEVNEIAEEGEGG